MYRVVCIYLVFFMLVLIFLCCFVLCEVIICNFNWFRLIYWRYIIKSINILILVVFKGYGMIGCGERCFLIFYYRIVSILKIIIVIVMM